jgi:hypothetical protein
LRRYDDVFNNKKKTCNAITCISRKGIAERCISKKKKIIIALSP